MMLLLALLFLLCAVLGVSLVYLYQNKDQVRVHIGSQPTAPTLLALLLGIGLSVIAIQVCGELPGILGVKQVYLISIKLLGLVVFASINGAAGVVAAKHFGGSHIKLVILLGALAYICTFGLLLGWAFYENEQADWIGRLWLKVLQKLYKAIGSPAPLGFAAIFVTDTIFLSCFSGILSSYVPVRSSTERNRAKVPVWANTLVTGLLGGAILALSGGLCTYTYETTENEYLSTLLKVFAGLVQGIITTILATTAVMLVNIQYEADNWQWRSFSIGGFAGLFWGIGHLYISRPENIHGDHPWAVISTSLLRAVVYGTSYGALGLLSTYWIFTNLNAGSSLSLS